jgi:hypothetical protein
MWIDDEKRKEAIKKILEKGQQYDAVAQSSSVEAVRNSGNEEKMASAKTWVAMADASEQTAQHAIDIINALWPRKKDHEN